MRELIVAIVFGLLLIAGLVAGGAQRREHFGQDDKVDPLKLDRVVDDIYSHLQIDDLDDARHYTDTDTSRVNATGFDTVYIGYHFTSDQFMIVAMPSTVSLIAVDPLSDSSFHVALYKHDGTAQSNIRYRWWIEGQIR